MTVHAYWKLKGFEQEFSQDFRDADEAWRFEKSINPFLLEKGSFKIWNEDNAVLHCRYNFGWGERTPSPDEGKSAIDTPHETLESSIDKFVAEVDKEYWASYGREVCDLAKYLCKSHGTAVDAVVHGVSPVINGIPDEWKEFSCGRLRVAWTFFVQTAQRALEFQKHESTGWQIGRFPIL